MKRSQRWRGVALWRLAGATLSVCGMTAAAAVCRAGEAVPAGLPAGGLSATINAGLPLVAQRVGIARDGVLSTYFFQNPEDAPVTTLLAFRAPRLTAYAADSANDLPGDDPLDFMALAVTVEGSSLRPATMQRASILGLDVTERLKADSVPLNPYVRQASREALGKLAADKRPFYREHGLAQWTAQGEPISVQWDVDTTFHWMQTFPANKSLEIELRYMPASGTAILTTEDLAPPGLLDGLTRDFCLTTETTAMIVGALKRDTLARSSDEGPALLLTRVDYDLSADAWAGLIPDFELTVRKPDKGGVVGFCAPGGTVVDRGDALAFTARSFVPRGVLSVLYAGAAVAP